VGRGIIWYVLFFSFFSLLSLPSSPTFASTFAFAEDPNPQPQPILSRHNSHSTYYAKPKLTSPLQEEAVSENLKNMLLVMSNGGYLAPPDENPQREELWVETWKRVNRFLPSFYGELFPAEVGKRKVPEKRTDREEEGEKLEAGEPQDGKGEPQGEAENET
jgi:hypothetical protein